MDRLLSAFLSAASRLGWERAAAPAAAWVRRRGKTHRRAATALAALELGRDHPVALLDETLRPILEQTDHGKLLIARAQRSLGHLARARQSLAAIAHLPAARRLSRQIDIVIGQANTVAAQIEIPAVGGNLQVADVSLWLSALRAANRDGGETLRRLDQLARGDSPQARTLAATLIHHHGRTGREAEAAALAARHGAARDNRIAVQAARLALRQRNPSAAAGPIARVAAGKSRRPLQIALALAQSRTDEALRLIDRDIGRRGITLWSTFLAGHVALWREDFSGAERRLRQAIAWDPGFGEAVADLALCLDCMGRRDDALALLEDDRGLVFRPWRVLPVEPGIDLANRNSALRHRIALLRRARRDDEASTLLRNFAGCEADDLAAWTGKPAWRGEKLDGKRVLIVASRGIGDELRHLGAFAPRLAACRDVSSICDPRLAELLQPALPMVTLLPVVRSRLDRRLAAAEEERRVALPPRLRGVADEAVVAAARHCDMIVDGERLAEIAAAMGEPRRLPLLRVPEAMVEAWRGSIGGLAGGRPVIGLCWRGLVRSYQRDAHYFGLGDLSNLLGDHRFAFLPLQPGIAESESAGFAALARGRWLVLPELDVKDDFSATAAACIACDIVLSAGTALAELAGAVGARTVLALPHPSSISAERALPDGRDRYWPSVTPMARGPGENRQQFIARVVDATRLGLNSGG